MSRRLHASSVSGSSTDARRPPVYAVILAGGEGTRLWPLARAGHPKQFLPLLRGRSLFRLTCDRVLPLVGRSRLLVVAGARHLVWVRRQAPEIPPSHILIEGTGRNTAASVALAALWIRKKDPDAIMIVLPADHLVGPNAAFVAALRRAVEVLRGANGLVIFGVTPHSADSGFGYIRPGPPSVARDVFPVAAFVEKPTPARARRMVSAGTHFWNSGIFVWRAATIIEEMLRYRPDVVRPLVPEAARWVAGPLRVPLAVMRHVPDVPIDKAVLERSRRVMMLRATFRWSDLGTWRAIWGALPKDGRKNAALGRVMALDADGCLGVNPAGMTVFLGVKDLFVIRSGDLILVLPRGADPRARAIVKRLRRLGLDQYL